MKRRLNKIVSLILCMCMMFSLMACATDKETAKESGTTQTSQEESKATEVKKEEPRKLTVGLHKNVNVEDYDTNALTLYLEESLNLDLEFVYFSADTSEAATQLSLMVSSGEKLPDILWGISMNLPVVNQYGQDGYFVDLTEYLNKETLPNFYEALERVEETSPGVKDRILSEGKSPYDGGYYALPHYAASSADNCLALVSINQTWLDKLGLTMPTTTDQLYDVLKAFATQDPNGNGKADEIPMIGRPSGYRSDIVQFIINAFVYCQDDYFFNVTDGKIWAPYDTEEYREALIYLNKLVSENLLSPSTWTITKADLMPHFTPADKVAITGVMAAHPTTSAEQDNEVLYEYAALAPLQAATDKGGYGTLWPNALNYNTFVTVDCGNVDLALEFLDYLYTWDASIRMRYGEKDVDWVEVSDGVTNVGTPAKIKSINSSVYGQQNNKTWNLVANAIVETSWWGVQVTQDDSWVSRRSALNNSILEGFLDAGQPEEVVYNIAYNQDEQDYAAEVMGVLYGYVREQRALFATGALDPNKDADWQKYLEDLEKQGYSKYIETAQAAYDRMNQ